MTQYCLLHGWVINNLTSSWSGWKTKPERVHEPSCGVNIHLAQWNKLGSMAIYGASVVITEHCWRLSWLVNNQSEKFIHWNQQSHVHDQSEHSNLRKSAVVCLREGWILPGLLAQDMLHINEYLSSFQSRYVVYFFTLIIGWKPVHSTWYGCKHSSWSVLVKAKCHKLN